MTPYVALKRCLIDGWPSANPEQCARMVLIDMGEAVPGEWISGAKAEDLFHTVKMPVSGAKSVSVYLAACYPRTSTALFDARPKDECLKIFLMEKHVSPDAQKNLHTFARREYKSQIRAVGGVTRFIRARDLNKKHDWSTVS